MLTVPGASAAAMAVLVAVGLLLMAMPVAEANECTTTPNGCSIPFGMPFFYKRKFTPSCNRHDICYGCGAARGITRNACDYEFLQNMIKACENSRRRRHASPEKRSACTSVANIYYKAVRKHGAKHYVNRDTT